MMAMNDGYEAEPQYLSGLFVRDVQLKRTQQMHIQFQTHKSHRYFYGKVPLHKDLMRNGWGLVIFERLSHRDIIDDILFSE